MNLNRRKVLSWFGLGWVASLLPSSLVGCSETKSPEVSATSAAPAKSAPVASAPSNAFKAIGTVAQLDKEISLLSGDKKVAVVRDPKNANKVLAVSASCTHKGCTVKWKASGNAFVCPCHDAEFAADGKVLKGPAKTPLQVYDAKIENGQVFVNV